MEGIQFESKPDDPWADSYTLTSNNKGVLIQEITTRDYALEFKVSLKSDQEVGDGSVWICDTTHTFKTNGSVTQAAEIIEIDGKQLAEIGEIVFHLTKEGTDTPSVDKSILEEKLNEAREFDNSDGKYTEESFQALETAIEEAQGVYDKEDAEQTEIDQQVEKLQAAIEGLKESGTSQPGEDKEALEDWISIAGSYLENDYTHESYAKLQEAVTKAESVLEDSQATKEQIQEACDAIEAAIQGLKPADNPVYCESKIIRIKVVDQNGDRITEDIPFITNMNGSEYNAYFYNGVIEEWLSGAVSGVNTIQIYLENGSVELDGKQYVTDPEQYEFGLKSGVNGMEINTVDGEPFDASRQLIFTLKEKTAGAIVNKEALEAAVTEAEGLISQKDSYTINSYNEFEAALEKAKAALDAEDIQQSEVDAAAAALELAKNNLKKVTGMRTLTIPVKMEDGSPAPVNVEFVRRSDQYGMNYPIYVDGEGKLTWKLTSGDSGDYIFFLPDTSAYIETPGEIVVHVGSEDGTPVIDTINGVPAAEASVQFTLSAKGTDTCDLTHFRAVVQDNHGNLLSGIKFNVENGDPAELTSDENGVITYEATSWDTDMTMKVALQDGQDWTTDQSMEFSVITDPNDPARGILGTINGQPFQGGEKLVFKLQKIGEVVLDWSVLETAMDKAGKLNPEIYTEETYKQVTEALKAAQNIYGDQFVSQEQINQAAASLEEAILQLQEKPVEPEQPQYSIIQGAGQQVTADQDAVFASSADYNKFVKVLIDGVELSADNYVVTEGSTVVTLKKEYVATLAEGTHTISIVSTDGIASTEFTVKKNQDVKPGDSDNIGDADSKNPSQNNGNTQTRPAGNISARTGDNSPVMIWAALAAAAVCLIAGITIIRRKKQ
ncbi:FIVAR domain-containing protein [Mordavella massiliensis]|nr:FIVAR domain-containing protein [Mordavella massiliensis]